ncbi:choice-of-anchor B family protein [Rubrivirga sp.]|uniref:choice-of-anchor B family protein n=1 Tax=Rubrivirga sp. TaxID=1885344 RepID=UPI003B5249D3
MTRLLALTLVLVTAASAQTLDLVGTVDLPAVVTDSLETGGSDVWGYVAPDGAEYAIMGDIDGVSVVAVPSLEVVARIPGPTEDARWYWRDIKTYGEYAYVVTEATGPSEGLQIIDLSGLPERAQEVAVMRGPGDALVSSHNLSIDTATGHAYVLDSNGETVVILDLDDPVAPVVVGRLDVGDVHDVFAREDRLYVAEGRNPTYSIWDTTDKAAPALVSRVTVPNAGYVHNVWPTDDGRHVVTTEETAEKTVKVWNVEDPENPELVGEWLGANRIAHNALVRGRYAFLSHYTAGVYVLDLADLSAPTVVARHDTYGRNDDVSMDGNWGVTLPSPGGYVYGSDGTGRLTVLRWTPPADL